MRKLFFVLLYIFAIALTGCHSADPPQRDSGSITDVSSAEDTKYTKPDQSEPETSSESAESTIPSELEIPSVPPTESKPADITPPVQNMKPPAPENISSGTLAQEETEPPSQTPNQAESTPNGQTNSHPSVPTDPQPSVPEPQKPNNPTNPNMESEYPRIISEATEYAQSYAVKGFTFVWDDTLVFGDETGYMGTPRVKYEGVNGTIEILKYHIDKIVQMSTDPENGVPGYWAKYKVVQVTVDGDIAFVVLYG